MDNSHTSFPSARRLLTYLLTLALTTAIGPEIASAQLGRKLRKAAERGAARALERNAERRTEEAVDEVLSGPGEEEQPSTSTRAGGTTGDSESTGLAESNGESGGSAEAPAEATPEPTPFAMTSKFDFEPGAEVIYYDDFARAELGDFPTGYNTLGTSEVVSVNTAPGKYLKLTQQTGGIVPMDLGELPEDFTLEFDLIQDVPAEGYRFKAHFNLVLTDTPDPERDVAAASGAGDHAAVFSVIRQGGGGSSALFAKQRGRDYTRGGSVSLAEHFNDERRGTPAHFALWRQGKRMRLYIDEDKVYDVPLAWNYDAKLAGIRFVTEFSDASDAYLLGNIRLAKGAPDTRSKLETEGKLVSYGITFASGSAEVETSSAGTLKRIAQTLEANPDMRLLITGHTDADGDADANLALSERRAVSVREVLTGNFGVSADRLETAGKGESELLSDEATPSGKAKNRRVVFEVL